MRGRWSRWGRGGSEGYSLELGHGSCRLHALVIRNVFRPGEAYTWRASVNQKELGDFPDRTGAQSAAEREVEIEAGQLVDDWTVYRGLKLVQGRRQ